MEDTIKVLKFRKLNIEDFRVFKDFEISFTDIDGEPLPLVLIAGVNGSGKTTILDILGKYLKSKKVIEHSNIKANIKLDYIVENKPIPSHNVFDKLFDNLMKTSNGPFEGLTLDTSKEKISKYVVYFCVGHTFFTKLKNAIPSYVKYLVYEKNMRANEVYEKLSEYIISIFKNMDLKITFSRMDKEKNLFFKNEAKQEFSIDDISTGEKTLLSNILYLRLLNLHGKVILIDEPETSIHPNWQNKILKLYENFAIKNDCQIIIATHSPHIIGSAKNEYLRILTNDENGNIKVIDNISECYGLEVNQVLTEIMGVESLRTPDIDKKFKDIKNMIVANKFDDDDFKIKWQELEDLLGEDYLDLKLLKLEIISRKKNV